MTNNKTNGPKIAAIGGGHGLSAMLRGLKKYTDNITAIVTVADDGGGSGVLRHDMGMLPPGDIRRCILALSNTEPVLEQLFDFRFSEGTLSGQSLGNLFLAALNSMSDSFDEAVLKMCQVLGVSGRVLPVTNYDVFLEAEFEDGSRVLGEHKIFDQKKRKKCRIKQVRLVPEKPQALPAAVKAIEEADLVVIAPGSLYTSIIPNLLVEGVVDAIARTKAKCVYACNLMSQEGETEGYTAADHIRALHKHSVSGLVDICIANCEDISEEMKAKYELEGAERLVADEKEFEKMGVELILRPLVADEGDYVRHDEDALARAIMEIL